MNILKLFYFFIFIFFVTSCNKASDGNAPSELPPPSATIPTTQLSISPSTKILSINDSFNFTALGGTAPYTFSIASGGGVVLTVVDQGQLTAPSTAGTVVIQLTDSAGGLVTANVTVNPALQISPASQTIMTNGTLSLSASGGVPPYFYSVSSGLGSIDSLTGLYTASATNTVANIIVTDSLGHTSNSTVTVTSALSLNPTSSTIVVNGNQTFTGVGGTPPYVYSILSGGGSINAVTGVFIAPAVAGTVFVQVTDSLSATASSTVTVNPALVISPTAITLSVNGSLTFSASGGVPPRVFSILSGAGTINSGSGLYTAPATTGTATVRVSDSLGNTADSVITLSQTLGIAPAAVTLAVNNSTTFSAVGGVAPFTYSILSGGGSMNSSTGAFTAPATAGTVVVQVTDSLSATATANVTVNSALTISPATITKAVSTSQLFTATGGVTPYSFSILSGGGSINSSTGAFTAPASAGSVVVRVTDALSNVSNSTVTIVSTLTMTPVSKTLSVNNVFSFLGVGGQTPYTYSVVSGGGSIHSSTGSYTAPATAGIAVVRVTDAIGQTADSSVTINSALAISPSSVIKAVGATHTFSATGGVSPYTYSIVTGGGSINSATGSFTAPVTAGSVVIRVTDSLSNTSDANVTVMSSVVISPITLTLAVNNSTLFSASGGLTPYAFSIVSGGGSVNSGTGAFTAPGSASTTVLRVTDALGQTSDATITVNAAVSISPATVSLAVNNTQVFSAVGGVSPYTYSLVSGGGSINSSSGLLTAPAVSGSVTVRVTDALSNTADAVVTVNPALAISPNTLNLATNGTSTFSATGGVSPFIYSIVSGGGSINSGTGAFTAPGASGSVVVRVTDSLLNTSNATVTVVTPVAINPLTKTLAVNNSFTFSASGGLAPYVFSVVSGGGSINSSTGAFTASATAGSTVVRVTDSLAQISNATITVNAAIAISPATITLAINNTTTFSASGGVSPYTYSIVSGGGSINSSTGAFTAPATAGTVVVRVTDSLLNSTNSTVTINPAVQISPTTLTLAVNNTTTFSASGGVSPYTYSIVSGGGSLNSSTGIFTAPASSGTVVVRVTDSLSNSSNSTVTVNSALVISPATFITSVNNSSTFTSTGGVPPVTYSIATGGGSIDPSTGAFTAPATSQIVTVRVTDSFSNISESAVTVNGPLSISPTTLNLVANGSQTFVGAGGVAPYTFSIVSGGGSIDSVTGDYTAAATAGSVTVRVTDSAATSVNASITVYDVLALSPSTITLPINAVQNFTASGGLGALTFSILSGGGSMNSTTGQFTAGISAETVQIQVQDTIGNSLVATATIVSSLTISPQTLKLPVFSTATFSSTLGTAPYSYSLFSGTGAVVAGTGVYTGGTTAGTDVVRSTDAGMNTSDATVTLIEPVQIVAGSTHYCVRYNEGSVKCWGLNSSGQLGYGDTVARGDSVNESGSNLPFVNLGTGRTAKYLAAGFTHTCAILDNDTLKCWGSNSTGQLGYGDTLVRGNAANQMGDSLPIVNVGTGRTVKKISAGSNSTCAILDNNTLKCWGYNLYGQIGRDNTTNAGNTAGSMGDTLAVVNLGVGRTAKDVSQGLDHTCVVLDDNTLKCFGRNNRGQLGKDSTTALGDTAGEMAALTAINLGAGRTAVSVSAGYSHTCAILDNATAKCWGLGTTGQLGKDNTSTLGDAAGEMAALTAINLGFNPTIINASRTRSCAMSAAGVTKCWGLNTSGQLAKGSTATLGDGAGEMAALAAINFGTSVTASTMASAWYSSCVITTNKRIKCFGSAANGALLNTSTTAHIGDAVGELGDGMPWVNH